MQNNNISESVSRLFQKKTWEDFFTKTPCVKTSYLWGAGCGSLMAAHKMRMYRKYFFLRMFDERLFQYLLLGGAAFHAFSAGLLTFVCISCVNFAVCANDLNKRYEMLRKAFEMQNIKEDNKKAHPPR
eukprot:gene10181-13698_t